MARKFHSRDWRRGRWEERRFAPTVGRHLGLEVKLGEGTFDPVDAELKKGRKVAAVCEFKRHYNRRGEFRDIIFETKKLQAVAQLAAHYGVKGYMAVRHDNADAIVCLDLTLPYRQGIATRGGDKARGDPFDRQPMMYIPMEHFVEMETVPYKRSAEQIEEAARDAIEAIRRKRSIEGINRAAQEYERLTWECDESEDPLIRARSHHIKNLCAYRRTALQKTRAAT